MHRAALAAACVAMGAAATWGLRARAPEPASSVGAVVPGVVTGQVPLCYGPGPDLNLTPTVVVVAMQQGVQGVPGRVEATTRVPATQRDHTYRLILSPGTYAVRAGSWPARQVTVSAGATAVADLPGGGCL